VSLLDYAFEDVVVYPEEVTTDDDGNTKTRPSATGIPAKARLQFQGQSGTSARRAEQDIEGFESEQVYNLRFPKTFTAEHGLLGMQSQIEWQGKRWCIFGDPRVYTSSKRTAHIDYIIRRF